MQLLPRWLIHSRHFDLLPSGRYLSLPKASRGLGNRHCVQIFVCGFGPWQPPHRLKDVRLARSDVALRFQGLARPNQTHKSITDKVLKRKNKGS